MKPCFVIRYFVSFVILEAFAYGTQNVGKFSSCISDVDFELLNTEFIVDLCFGFRKPNLCVGFTGLGLNSFGTTLTSLLLGSDTAVQVVDLFGSRSIWKVQSFIE